MPELPEVETIARGIHRAVAGHLITGVEIPRPDVLREATPRTFGRRVTGTRITNVRRRAKHVVISLDSGDALVIQPRFTGALFAKTPGQLDDSDRTYLCVALALDDGRILGYRDIRRLGTVALMSPERQAEYFGALGAEPLDEAFTAERLSGILRGSKQAVKKVIMDQYRVVGVGNIYANEALWRARIDPSRSAAKVTPEEAATLRDAIVDVLREAIDAGGSSIRDYRDATGAEGEFAQHHAAYGRAGEPCLRCGARLVGTHEIDGRQTVLCARCQH